MPPECRRPAPRMPRNVDLSAPRKPWKTLFPTACPMKISRRGTPGMPNASWWHPSRENRAAPLECRIAPPKALHHHREELRNRRRGVLRAVRARAGVLATILRPRAIGPASLPQKAPLECRTSAGIPSKASHARCASRRTDWRNCGRLGEAVQGGGLRSSS